MQSVSHSLLTAPTSLSLGNVQRRGHRQSCLRAQLMLHWNCYWMPWIQGQRREFSLAFTSFSLCNKVIEVRSISKLCITITAIADITWQITNKSFHSHIDPTKADPVCALMQGKISFFYISKHSAQLQCLSVKIMLLPLSLMHSMFGTVLQLLLKINTSSLFLTNWK